jgi:hypothetical protein
MSETAPARARGTDADGTSLVVVATAMIQKPPSAMRSRRRPVNSIARLAAFATIRSEAIFRTENRKSTGGRLKRGVSAAKKRLAKGGEAVAMLAGEPDVVTTICACLRRCAAPHCAVRCPTLIGRSPPMPRRHSQLRAARLPPSASPAWRIGIGRDKKGHATRRPSDGVVVRFSFHTRPRLVARNPSPTQCRAYPVQAGLADDHPLFQSRPGSSRERVGKQEPSCRAGDRSWRRRVEGIAVLVGIGL